MNTAKKTESTTRAKILTNDIAAELASIREENAQIRDALTTLIRDRRIAILPAAGLPARRVSSLEDQLVASVEEAKQEAEAGRYSQVNSRDSGSLVGKRFYVRVTGQKILCEVVKEEPGQRRGFYVRRVDNGRMLTRARSRAALHEDNKPLSFPPKARTT